MWMTSGKNNPGSFQEGKYAPGCAHKWLQQGFVQYTCQWKVSFPQRLVHCRVKAPIPDRWSSSVFPGAAQGDKESDFQQLHSDPQRTRVRVEIQAVKERCRKVRAGLVHGHSLWGMEERIEPPKSYSIACRGLDSIVHSRGLGHWLSHQGRQWFWCRATVGLQLPTYGANI